MLKRTCIFVAALSFLVVLGLPIAQAQSVRQLIVHVPFDFYVGDRMLPAGAYSISALDMNAAGEPLLLRSEENNTTIAVLTNSAEAKGRKLYAPHLLFNRYGDQYFLTSAWPDAHAGRALPQSGRERSLRRELAQAGHSAAAPE